jgi:hypothetical protein
MLETEMQVTEHVERGMASIVGQRNNLANLT